MLPQLKNLKKVTEPRPGEEIFGMTMITLKGKTILVADTNVQDFPSPERLVKFLNLVFELQDYLVLILKLHFYLIQLLENLFQKILNM